MKQEMREISLKELARIVGGTADGDGSVLIKGVCSLENPKEGYIALCVEKMKPVGEKPSALIVSKRPSGIDLPLLIHSDPRLAFAEVLRYFHPEEKAKGFVHPKAVIADSARIEADAYVGANAVIEANAKVGSKSRIGAGCYVGENSVIGSECILYPNVTVMQDVEIGDRCIIHSGAVIGSDGFGFTPSGGVNVKVPQVGKVKIGNDVEIGANTTIDRATLDETVIEDDVKIDNLVQIAHNVRIGEHTRIAGQTGLTGRVKIGANVVVGGQVGFNNGVVVGDNCMIGAQSGVMGDLQKGSRVSGYPAQEHRKALRILALCNRLPEIVKRLEAVERKIKEQ